MAAGATGQRSRATLVWKSLRKLSVASRKPPLGTTNSYGRLGKQAYAEQAEVVVHAAMQEDVLHHVLLQARAALHGDLVAEKLLLASGSQETPTAWSIRRLGSSDNS